MKIISIDRIRNTERDVEFDAGRSLRLAVSSDNLGFSFHQTEIKKSDVPYHWHYKSHLELCFCISGKGELTSIEDGYIRSVLPGTAYILDQHDDHLFKAIEDTILISVFNPPVAGDEIHDVEGSYILDYSRHVEYLTTQIMKYIPYMDIEERERAVDKLFKQLGLNFDLFSTKSAKI